MPDKIIEIVRQLSDMYEINESDVIPIVETTIRKSIILYFGRDTDVHYDGSEFEIYTYNGEAKPTQLNLNDASKKFISFLKRQLIDRFLIEKALTEYNAIKHIQGTLVDGYLLERMKGYCLIKLNDMPFKTKNILSYRYKIPRESLKFNEHYFFIVSKIKVVRISYKFELVVFLSRTSKKLPNLLLQKVIEEKTGVNIDCKCTERVAGKHSVIKTKTKIPREIILFVQENLNNEKIIIKR